MNMPTKSEISRARMADPVYHATWKTLCVLVHLIGVVQNWYAIYYDYTYVHFQRDDQFEDIEFEEGYNPNFGGKFKFLTFLNAILQAIYFSIALMNDIVGTNRVGSHNQLPKIRRIKDYMIASLAFPIACNVSITFWALYAIDRELVFPERLDAIFPSWLNHVMHTNILIFILMEMCICFRQYPTRRRGMTGLIAFMLSYLAWLHVVKYYSGAWVYPVLDVLNFPQRLAFFAASLCLTMALYTMGETFNKTLWKKELHLVRDKTP